MKPEGVDFSLKAAAGRLHVNCQLNAEYEVEHDYVKTMGVPPK